MYELKAIFENWYIIFTGLLQITYDENTFFYNQLIINFIFYDEFCSTERSFFSEKKVDIG